MGSAASRPTRTSATPASHDHEKPLSAHATRTHASHPAQSAAELLSRLSIASPVAPGTIAGALVPSELTGWTADLLKSPSARFTSTVLSKADILSSLAPRAAPLSDAQVFNLRIPVEGTPVTNQKSSGRCWLFACCNVARIALSDKLGLDGTDFQLSQSWLFYFDKLEKANYYLEAMIELAEEEEEDRLVQFLSEDPENDGGQWDMVVNLIERYGLVPQSIYPESFNSSNTSKLDHLLQSKLREFALELRDLHEKTRLTLVRSEATSGMGEERMREMAVRACRARKTEQMEIIHRIVTLSLGAPPSPTEPFTWEYYVPSTSVKSTGTYRTLTCTPLEFYQTYAKPSGFDVSSCFSVINDPRNAYDTLYTVAWLGNVWGGRRVQYVNAQSATLKDLVVRMIKAGRPVWFGCDVGKESNSALGVMDKGLYEYETAFGPGSKPGMNKAQRLRLKESAMTHAMVITAVHLDQDGEPVRFRVENSWSDTAGEKGYFVASADWFDEYVYQVVVPKSVAPKRLVDVLEKGEAKVLPAWDPMGTLA